ncbi:MAG: ribosome assembly cofactor RimP [Prevotellaceae bacterium]|nr:ribosome assembly cofactor RimP [Prevotellaceae bacterium]
MIESNLVRQAVEEFLSGTGCFIVDIKVGKDNFILIEIDSEEGISIDYCAELARFIESKVDREVEDYELEVGSPGLGSPFKVLEQYRKHEGCEVEVQSLSGAKLQGILANVSETGFDLEVTKKVKPEGAKRKMEVTENIPFKYENVKYTKYIIRFK